MKCLKKKLFPMIRLTTFSFIVFFIFLFTVLTKAQDQITVPITDFNPESLENENVSNPKWSILSLPRRDNTTYELIEMDNRTVIQAKSVNSASGLVYQIDIDPQEYPIIEWSWKVNSVLEKGDYSTKKGDDYPARIYITFDYDKKNLGLGDRIKYATIKTFTRFPIPLRAINYIWANKADKGTIAPNAYTNWVYMIAVQSGDNSSGEWKIETQNIYEDYLKAFGEAPPPINGVAIMTDSDNTKGETEAYYGDIIFKKENSSHN